MDVEESLAHRAAVHSALGEPARLAIADALALGDTSPGELGAALGMSSNLLAHHLGVLADVGIVVRSRSESDRRRTYVRLSAVAYPFVTARVSADVQRVVFVCTQNSARSQLAAALWGRAAGVPAASAGTRPASRVHPQAAAVARRHGLSLRRARTAQVRDVVRGGDLVVAVCDRAYEELAGRPAEVNVRLHWSVPDPARREDDPTAFSDAFTILAERVDRLASAVNPSSEEAVP